MRVAVYREMELKQVMLCLFSFFANPHILRLVRSERKRVSWPRNTECDMNNVRTRGNRKGGWVGERQTGRDRGKQRETEKERDEIKARYDCFSGSVE